VGGDRFYLKFCMTRWSEIAEFQSTFARSTPVVAPSEKLSINTDRKSTARLPMSLRWTSYVARNSPRQGLRNTKWSFSIWNRTLLEESLLPVQSFFCVTTVSNKVVRHSLAYLSVRKWLVGTSSSTWKFGEYWSTPCTTPICNIILLVAPQP